MDIFELAKKSDDEHFEALIKEHELTKDIVNQVDKSNRTPLFYAISCGNLKMTKHLLSLGAKCRNDNYTPFLVACYFGQTHIASYLLNKSSLKERDSNNNTALIDAANLGHTDTVRFLLEQGSDVNAQNTQGDTALLVALRYQHEDVARLLLGQESIDIKTTNVLGYDCFVLASFYGFLDIANSLLSQGFDINREYTEKNTLLHMATMDGNDTLLKWLFAHGANPSMKNSHSQTPLMIAASRGHAQLLPVIIEQYKKIKKLDNDFHVATIAAAHYGHQEVLDTVLTHKKKFSNLFMQFVLLNAVVEGHWNIVSTLLDLKPKKNNKRINKHYHYNNKFDYNDSSTLLHAAAHKGHLNIVKNLVERGAKLTCRNNNNEDVLHFAIKSGNVDLVQWLCQQKIDVNRKNKQGNTPLHLAIKEKNSEITACLLEYGANLTIKNNSKETPIGLSRHTKTLDTLILQFKDKNYSYFSYSDLHEAAANGQEKALLQTLPFIDNTNPLSKFGATPMQVATRMGNNHSVAILFLWDAKGNRANAIELAREALKTFHKKSPGYKTIKNAIQNMNKLPEYRLQSIINHFDRVSEGKDFDEKLHQHSTINLLIKSSPIFARKTSSVTSSQTNEPINQSIS
jgi:ankyrin repeat protein